MGIGLCVLWRIQGDVRHAAETPVGFGSARPVNEPDTDRREGGSGAESVDDTFGGSPPPGRDGPGPAPRAGEPPAFADADVPAESSDVSDAGPAVEPFDDGPDLSGADGWEPESRPR